MNRCISRGWRNPPFLLCTYTKRRNNMQMNLNVIKNYEKYQNYKNSGKKDSERAKYINNKRRAARVFKEEMKKALISKYEEE